MTERQNSLTDFESRLVNLKLEVEKIAGLMQTESEEARRALTLYGRTRRLLTSFLGRAASHQGKACHLGQRLAGYRDQLKALHRDIDALSWKPAEQDRPRLTAARRELRRIAEQIHVWSVESDGLQ